MHLAQKEVHPTITIWDAVQLHEPMPRVAANRLTARRRPALKIHQVGTFPILQ